MVTNNFIKSDLNKLYSIVSNAMISYPKESIIANLRDYFSKDVYYRFVKDEWGFPKVVDHTDLELDAGMFDKFTTRLNITEYYPHEAVHFPALFVRNNGSKYVPISAYRNYGVKYSYREYEDGLGNSFIFRNPDYFTFDGIWEGNFSVEIIAESLEARDELVEQVAICLTDITFDTFEKAGLIVKPVTISAANEIDDPQNTKHKLYRQTVSFDVRSEWHREIPIGNVIESIVFAVEFLDTVNDGPVAQNLTIITDLNIVDNLLDNLSLKVD